MSSMQLFNLINSLSPRLGPQSSPAAAFSEHRFAIHAHQYVLLNKKINPILYYTILFRIYVNVLICELKYTYINMKQLILFMNI